ncbi:MAG: TIGR01777 family oxidoreductase [Actinomycetota bacterium]
MKIAISGSTGFIGRAVSSLLKEQGHMIHPLLRPSTPIENGIRWNPAGETIDLNALEGIDAIINLSGESIGAARWTKKQKQQMYSSRVQSTKVLANAIGSMSRKPAVFISASASGFYGERGEELVTEQTPKGSGFLADLCAEWERAAQTQTRTVLLRSGIVLGASGGLLNKLLPVFKLGAGARLGSGTQWMPWITIRDEARAIAFVLQSSKAEGPYNLSSPNPVRNKEFTKLVATALHRKAFLSVPTFALETMFGKDATHEAFLVSQRMIPQHLLDEGFNFDHASMAESMRAVLEA